MIEPTAGGCHVVQEETQVGPLPSSLRAIVMPLLRREHRRWLDGLARVALDSPPRLIASARVRRSRSAAGLSGRTSSELFVERLLEIELPSLLAAAADRLRVEAAAHASYMA